MSQLLGAALAAVVSAGAVTAGMMFVDKNNVETRARLDADLMMTFQAASAQYYMDHHDALIAATTTGAVAPATDICKIGVSVTDGTGGTSYVDNSAGKHYCGMDANMLKFSGYLPAGFSLTNKDGQSYVVIYRQIYNATNTTATGSLEALVVMTGGMGTNPNQISTSAQIVGASSGIAPKEDFGHCLAGQICGIASGWKVTPSDFGL